MKEMNDYTHIILDEVHEREVDMDFAMLIIKDFLRNNSPNVKVSFQIWNEFVLEALTQPVCQQHGYFCKHSRIVFKNKVYFKKRDSDLLRWISHLDKSVISYLWSKSCTLGLWVIFRCDSSQRLAACGPRLAADGLSRKKLLHGVFSEIQVYIDKVFTRQWRRLWNCFAIAEL